MQHYQLDSDKWAGMAKLLEEMGELQQVCGKLMGSDGDENHWSGNLREKFIEELADVKAAFEFFVKNNFTKEDRQKIKKRAQMKTERFNGWSIKNASDKG